MATKAEPFIDVATAARALGKTSEAVRRVIERHDVPIDNRGTGRVRVRVRLSELQRVYDTKVADRGW
jgi:hypothetical protein